MGELTAGVYPARNGNGNGGLVSKLVWALLTATTTAAMLTAGSMLLEHDRALAQQQVRNEQLDEVSGAVVKISEAVSLLQQEVARRDGREAGERDARGARAASSSTSP